MISQMLENKKRQKCGEVNRTLKVDSSWYFLNSSNLEFCLPLRRITKIVPQEQDFVLDPQKNFGAPTGISI